MTLKFSRGLEETSVPFNFNRGISDSDLEKGSNPQLHLLPGGNFFRGLALIDLAEAMLKRAFGEDAVAVRVNAAGQGDFFQIHIDRELASIEDVKQFLAKAFYARFDLNPKQALVETHPGGGAIGCRLGRFKDLRDLIDSLAGRSGLPAASDVEKTSKTRRQRN